MRCIVTAGPTYEPLDSVRRLTNFSTGRLGGELARYLTERGHEVLLLIGEQASWTGERRATATLEFSTTAHLGELLRERATPDTAAVFHAAAVSDFAVGRIWEGGAEAAEATAKRAAISPGTPSMNHGRKISSRGGRLLVELLPTPKILAQLRGWYPRACLVGWKYEIEGNRRAAIARAANQLKECSTNGCVLNGRAYGEGFGFVDASGRCRHVASREELYALLESFAAKSGRDSTGIL